MLLSQRLLNLRKGRKLTQKELSSKLGIARTTYSGYELGTSEPDNETLQKIADFYNESTDYLLGRESKEETQLEKDKKYALELIMGITDPDKKKAAIEYLKFLAGEK